ncbi:hypothetical protein DIZ76_017638 [Coccidioides immitis]|nr:hypothetical protein DIZ76_017638 [Coccidioides immitis]
MSISVTTACVASPSQPHNRANYSLLSQQSAGIKAGSKGHQMMPRESNFRKPSPPREVKAHRSET